MDRGHRGALPAISKLTATRPEDNRRRSSTKSAQAPTLWWRWRSVWAPNRQTCVLDPHLLLPFTPLPPSLQCATRCRTAVCTVSFLEATICAETDSHSQDQDLGMVLPKTGMLRKRKNGKSSSFAPRSNTSRTSRSSICTKAKNARSLRRGSGRPGVACESFRLARFVLPPTPLQEIMAPMRKLGGTRFCSRSVSPPCILGWFAL